jgi:SARP family transcriptional regulator, regulator of embCAB operon
VSTDWEWDLRLMGGWQLLRAGRPMKMALRQQRLLAALALKGEQSRSYLADLLWPESTESQAAGSLRESIFLVNRNTPEMLEQAPDSVGLAPRVRVDVRQIAGRTAMLDDAAGISQQQILLEDLQAPLLPGWYEDWVTAEQEKWQRLRLSVLERLARLFLAREDIDAAMAAACAALAVEPLRESAQALRMECYLAEGNNAEALRAYRSFSLKLRQELGVSPAPVMSDLLGPLLTDI